MILNEKERHTNGAMVHWRISKVAKEIAGKYYDKFALDDEFYKLYPKESQFIEKEWGRYVPEARHVLTLCLNSDRLSESEKEEILEALLLDRSLPVGRMSGVKQGVWGQQKRLNRLYN